jgi:serine/threonine protein kinase
MTVICAQKKFCKVCDPEGMVDKTRIIPPRKELDPYQTRIEEPSGRYEEKPGDIFGDCVIERPLGLGGAAAVYLAHHSKLEAKRAIKVLKAEHVGNSGVQGRFIREAKISARLNHPGIVQVYDTGEQNGKPFIEMEYVAGSSLRRLLEERCTVGFPAALAIAEQVAEALSYAHTTAFAENKKAGVVHRDIKPENILVRPDGRVQIADFGIAKTAEWTGETLQGTIMGTCGYMPVEQIDGKEADARSDLYSLSVVLYEMLSGTLPFRGTTYTMLLKSITSGVFTPLRRLNRCLPREAEALVRRGLSAKPEDRFPDAASFAAGIRKLRPDRDVPPARAISRWLNAPEEKTGPRRSAPFLVPLLLLGLAAVIVLAVINQRHLPPRPATTTPPSSLIKAELPVPVVSAPVRQADSVQTKAVRAEARRGPAPTVIRPPGRTTGTPLERGKAFFDKGNFFDAERLFKEALRDTVSRMEAGYYLIRITDARFRAGQMEFKEELKSRWQSFIRDYSACKNCGLLVKDAKERLLYVIAH